MASARRQDDGDIEVGAAATDDAFRGFTPVTHPGGQDQNKGDALASSHSSMTLEKDGSSSSDMGPAILDTTSVSSSNPLLRSLQDLSKVLAKYQVESVSVAPVPKERRRERKWWSVGTLWFTANFNSESWNRAHSPMAHAFADTWIRLSPRQCCPSRRVPSYRNWS